MHLGQRPESQTLAERPYVGWSPSLSSIISCLAAAYFLCFNLTDSSVDCIPSFRAFAYAVHLSGRLFAFLSAFGWLLLIF